ncbi:MAG: TetR/AcrR family transcriptional regulator [Cyanobacteria bacterium Co-bin13]|nr:TetR/AcrR family transcriptional regulator [Cyanobacteria bacterium Co-bin13]
MELPRLVYLSSRRGQLKVLNLKPKTVVGPEAAAVSWVRRLSGAPLAKSSAKSGRSPSRQVRDAEATRTAILDAAEEEFARFGLNGARTEAIAAKTGVTKAMIYYYFGSKEDLYQEVLKRPFDDLFNSVANLSLDEMTPEAAVEALIEAAIAYESSHPYQQMILFQEASQNQGNYLKDAGLKPIYAKIIELLERGMAEGSFRPLDPWFTAIQIGGVVSFYFTTYENMKNIAPDWWDFRNPDMIARHKREAIQLVLRGLRAD